MSERPKKAFDCIRMKREIQERIYAETKDMAPADLLRYFQERAQESGIRGTSSSKK